MTTPAATLRRAASVVAAGAILALGACSSEAPAQALDSARSACTSPAPALPAGFDVRTASADQLSALASSAAARKAFAEEAATADDRWQTLADASTAISSFAGVLRDAEMTGRPIDDVVTRDMWDQYKYASDAFVLECQGVVALSS